MKIEIFGIQFDNLTMDEAIEQMQGLPAGRQGFVVLPYSEFVVRAQKDKEFRNILNKADFCLCEGRGLYLMARLLGKKLKQNINGIELIKNLKGKIFLFGGTREVVKKTAEKLGKNIVGLEHGYQDYGLVVQKINSIKPNILLVGLGSPKQEEFIYNNLSKIPSVELAIGIGGAFDFISEHVKRAPRIIQKIGMEWAWRLMVQPKRFKRIFIGVCGLTCLTFKNLLLLNKKGF
jgi:N-acetylglucosaminyldiphosphoundecaprenol N-acetyl-beta-D-mannosaminyltransferase